MFSYWALAWSAWARPCTCRKRGRDVILVDRQELAGEGTSFGNAGMIECASVFPYMFPRDFGQILQYAMNRAPHVRYSIADLPTLLPWLVRYFLASSPERAMHSAMAELPLIRRSLIEHEALIAEAEVPELLRRTGWIKLFRSDATLGRRGARSRTRSALRRRRRGARSQGDRRARAEYDRRFRRRHPLADARFRSRSGRVGQGLCGAVQAQGRTLSRRRRPNAGAGRRRLARRRTARCGDRARSRGRAGTMVGPGVSSARIFHPARHQARLPSASGAARQRRAQSSRFSIRIAALCWRR